MRRVLRISALSAGLLLLVSPALAQAGPATNLRLKLAAAYAGSHHLKAAQVKVSAVSAVRIGQTEYALARIAGAAGQPEMFEGMTHFRDLGASNGKPCSFPAAAVKALSYGQVCSNVSSAPSPPPGWTRPAHWCSISDPCADADIKSGCPSSGSDCDAAACQQAALDMAWYSAMAAKGSQILETLPVPPTGPAALQEGTAIVLINVGAAGGLQAKYNTFAYCDGTDFWADDQAAATAATPAHFAVSIGLLDPGLAVNDEEKELTALMTAIDPNQTTQNRTVFNVNGWTASVSVDPSLSFSLTITAPATPTSP